MTDSPPERPDWISLNRFVQDLITGVSRRHTFSQWELEFLFDLQTSRLRKSNREAVLRKYLRAAHLTYQDGSGQPPRLTTFLAAQLPVRSAKNAD